MNISMDKKQTKKDLEMNPRFSIIINFQLP